MGREGLQKTTPEAAAPHLQCDRGSFIYSDRGSGEAESPAVFFTFAHSFFSHFLAVISLRQSFFGSFSFAIRKSDHRSEVFVSCAKVGGLCMRSLRS